MEKSEKAKGALSVFGRAPNISECFCSKVTYSAAVSVMEKCKRWPGALHLFAAG